MCLSQSRSANPIQSEKSDESTGAHRLIDSEINMHITIRPLL